MRLGEGNQKSDEDRMRAKYRVGEKGVAISIYAHTFSYTHTHIRCCVCGDVCVACVCV